MKSDRGREIRPLVGFESRWQRRDWLHHQRLSGLQKVVLFVMDHYADMETAQCELSHSEIASYAGVCRGTVFRVLRDLRELGYLSVVNRQHLSMASRYTLTMPN